MEREMEDLFDTGQIIVGTPFRRPNRHAATGLVIVEEQAE